MRYDDRMMDSSRPPYSGDPAMYYPTNMGRQRSYSDPYYEDRQSGPYAEEARRQRPRDIPIRGRVVNSFDDIFPNEIPMDGGVSYFALPDGSAIMGKMWTKDGRLIPVKYIPEPQEVTPESNTNTASSVSMDVVVNRLDQLSQLVLDLYDQFTTYISPSNQTLTSSPVSKQQQTSRKNQNKEDEAK